MTVDALIQSVLESIWKDFYAPDRAREFHRDKHALLKAIARYGYHCEQRGWSIDPEWIRMEIMHVLESARRRRAAIKYLPVYLDSALTRAIGQRAEELKLASMMTKGTAAAIIRKTTVVEAVRQPTTTETLGMLYKSLRKPKTESVKCVQKKLF